MEEGCWFRESAEGRRKRTRRKWWKRGSDRNARNRGSLLFSPSWGRHDSKGRRGLWIFSFARKACDVSFSANFPLVQVTSCCASEYTQRILAFFLAMLIYQPPWCQTRGVAASCCFEVVSHKYDRNESFSRILDRTGGSLPCTCSFTTVILFEKERDFSFFAPWFTLSPRVLFPLTLEISLFSPNKLFLWSYARCAFASFLFREIKFYKLVRFSGHRKSVCPLCDHRRVLYRMLTLDHAKNFRGQRQM